MAYRHILLFLGGLCMSGASYPQAAPTKDEQAKAHRISFERGTLSEYVKRLQTLWPDANIVIDKEAGTVELPPIALGKASLPQAVRWVEGTADARKKQVMLQSYRVAREPGDVYLFTKGRASEARATDVLSHEFLAGAEKAVNRPEKFQAAIENMLKASGSGQGSVTLDQTLPQLIVKGTPEELRQARDIIARLSAQNAEAPLRREVDQLRRDVEQLRKQLEAHKPEAKAAGAARR
jgi:hypothetical protein